MSFIKGSWNDKATLPMKCPECGHTTDELFSKLQESKSCICAGCGKSIVITGDGLADLEKLQKIIEGFK
ncbi:MAG: YnfU family zinc-binding protein [Syntrophales bacterium]|nr:YnfU family zinc-binding protein [Syntrophales bacterium]